MKTKSTTIEHQRSWHCLSTVAIS